MAGIDWAYVLSMAGVWALTATTIYVLLWM
jgi:hypothetical protein